MASPDENPQIQATSVQEIAQAVARIIEDRGGTVKDSNAASAAELGTISGSFTVGITVGNVKYALSITIPTKEGDPYMISVSDDQKVVGSINYDKPENWSVAIGPVTIELGSMKVDLDIKIINGATIR